MSLIENRSSCHFVGPAQIWGAVKSEKKHTKTFPLIYYGKGAARPVEGVIGILACSYC